MGFEFIDLTSTSKSAMEGFFYDRLLAIQKLIHLQLSVQIANVICENQASC